MVAILPDWVDEVARLPIAFAQVREDARQDLWVVEEIGHKARVIMVTSGGCTAAALAACGRVGHLHLVDPNPAQNALAALKLRLLGDPLPTRRLILGHSAMPAAHRAMNLEASGVVPGSLGPPDFVAEVGPDHVGRYEQLFVHLREALHDHRDELRAVLRLSDPPEQARRVAPDTDLGRALDEAFDEVMALPILVRLFGEGATRNRVESFALHFARRTRHVLATLPAGENPYLWQVLAGRYPDGFTSPWLDFPVPSRMPEITWTNSFMTDALRDVPGEFDFVHLSNILDWLSPEEARTTLELAAKALRPGGWVLIRQLNSTLDIPAAGPMFTWDFEQAQQLHAADRSYFYRALHLGRKR